MYKKKPKENQKKQPGPIFRKFGPGAVGNTTLFFLGHIQIHLSLIQSYFMDHGSTLDIEPYNVNNSTRFALKYKVYKIKMIEPINITFIYTNFRKKC